MLQFLSWVARFYERTLLGGASAYGSKRYRGGRNAVSFQPVRRRGERVALRMQRVADTPEAHRVSPPLRVQRVAKTARVKIEAEPPRVQRVAVRQRNAAIIQRLIDRHGRPRSQDAAETPN